MHCALQTPPPVQTKNSSIHEQCHPRLVISPFGFVPVPFCRHLAEWGPSLVPITSLDAGMCTWKVIPRVLDRFCCGEAAAAAAPPAPPLVAGGDAAAAAPCTGAVTTSGPPLLPATTPATENMLPVSSKADRIVVATEVDALAPSNRHFVAPMRHLRSRSASQDSSPGTFPVDCSQTECRYFTCWLHPAHTCSNKMLSG